jgi:hypothetical protein
MCCGSGIAVKQNSFPFSKFGVCWKFPTDFESFWMESKNETGTGRVHSIFQVKEIEIFEDDKLNTTSLALTRVHEERDSTNHKIIWK